MAEPAQKSRLLVAWSEGQQVALDDLIPLVHEELRRPAHRHMGGERGGHTLQITARVNCQQVRWRDRTHFFAVSPQWMQRILVDFARSRQYRKRGAGTHRVRLDESLAMGRHEVTSLAALDAALESLATVGPRKRKVVELRFFGGLKVEELAEVLHVSPQTVLRDWKLAKARLLREMKGS